MLHSSFSKISQTNKLAVTSTHYIFLYEGVRGMVSSSMHIRDLPLLLNILTQHPSLASACGSIRQRHRQIDIGQIE